MLDRLFLSAGVATPETLYVEDAFNTWLYTGTGTGFSITNGVNLSGNGGLVWVKCRSTATTDHFLFDTARGTNAEINSNQTTGSATLANSLTAFNTNGFSIGTGAEVNTSARTYATWTFRKSPKFFDVVSYTGTGANRAIAHNLGVAPGCILVKRTDTTGAWQVYHRAIANTEYIVLNTSVAKATGATRWNSTTPTATEFTVGTDATVNANGGTYVAYLFAHDTAAGNIVQCGSYTGNGSATGPVVDLGWEPQWLLIKNASGTGNWQLFDNMRGMPVGTNDNTLQANANNAQTTNVDYLSPTSTGFQITSTSTEVNTNGSTYLYVAIRRGPMRTPTAGTSVYGAVARTGNNTVTNVTPSLPGPSDLVFIKMRNTTTHGFVWNDRLRNLPYLSSATTTGDTNSTSAFAAAPWDVMDGVNVGAGSTGAGSTTNFSSNTYINYFLRRAPGFFDEVCYTGTGVARTVSHNLGAVPELMILKARSTTSNWTVCVPSLSMSAGGYLNTTAALTGASSAWGSPTMFNNTAPTSTVITIGDLAGPSGGMNVSGTTYVAYLLASCPGVSKIGTYTGNGSSQTINCGFSGGARFVMIKRTDSTGDWYVWDTTRGIVAANDPRLSLNTTAVEVTTDDTVDTDSTGFIVNQVAATNVNVNAATYIYLAIA